MGQGKGLVVSGGKNYDADMPMSLLQPLYNVV